MKPQALALGAQIASLGVLCLVSLVPSLWNLRVACRGDCTIHYTFCQYVFKFFICAPFVSLLQNAMNELLYVP